MDEVQDLLAYMKKEHNFTEEEFVKMFSEDELVEIASAQDPKKAFDDFLEDNYYGRIRKNWFMRIQAGGEVEPFEPTDNTYWQDLKQEKGL